MRDKTSGRLALGPLRFSPRTLSLTRTVFLATVSCFVAATVFVTVRTFALAKDAEVVAENAMPSIWHLSAARSELWHLDSKVDDAITDGPEAKAALDETIGAIEGEVMAYRRLPSFADEAQYVDGVRKALLEVRQAVVQIREELIAGDLGGARRDLDGVLRPAVSRADNPLRILIDFNQARGTKAAHEARDLTNRLAALAFMLDAIIVALALPSMLFALRMTKRYARVVAERADDLEQFAGRAAHDIRGPLMPALLALQWIQKNADEATRRMAERGERSLAQVDALIRDLLAFSLGNAEPERNARASIRQGVEGALEAAQSLAAAKDTEVRVEPFQDCAAACAPGVLAIIVSNLVQNAIKYMGDRPVRRVTLRCLERGSSIRLEVEDTGPGVPPDAQSTIFEPYVRGPHGREPGLGLGLATVKRLSLAYGRRVGVRSVQGEGATFWVELRKAGQETEPSSFATAPSRS